MIIQKQHNQQWDIGIESINEEVQRDTSLGIISYCAVLSSSTAADVSWHLLEITRNIIKIYVKSICFDWPVCKTTRFGLRPISRHVWFSILSWVRISITWFSRQAHHHQKRRSKRETMRHGYLYVLLIKYSDEAL